MGLPNARLRRTTQSTESDIADVDGEALPNTTASGPDSSAIAVSSVAMVSSASSQLIGSQPEWGAPLGGRHIYRVRAGQPFGRDSTACSDQLLPSGSRK